MQRVRCRQCQVSLIQLYQGDLLYALQLHGAEQVSQHLPAYSYRTLTDPTPWLACPRCGVVPSPVTTTLVLSTTIVTEHQQER